MRAAGWKTGLCGGKKRETFFCMFCKIIQPSEMLLKQTDLYTLSCLLKKIRISDVRLVLTFETRLSVQTERPDRPFVFG